MFETTKLRGRIVEKYGTLGQFAKEAGCSMSFLSQYMNGKASLDQRTIDKWVALLDILDEDIRAYFFTAKVRDVEQED
jgi:transcriptional regulator with XRE-family HTH domain